MFDLFKQRRERRAHGERLEEARRKWLGHLAAYQEACDRGDTRAQHAARLRLSQSMRERLELERGR